MTADQAYSYHLPLSFLGEGKFTAHLFLDPADAKANYEALSTSTKVVTARDVITLPMRPAGGAALYFEPEP